MDYQTSSSDFNLTPVVMVLVGLFLIAKTHVRVWCFRPSRDRVSFATNTGALWLIDGFALLALGAAVCFAFQALKLWQTLLLIIVAVGYDLLLRAWFLHAAVTRLRSESPKLSLKDARHHISRRARLTY